MREPINPPFQWSYATLKSLLFKTGVRWSDDSVPRLSAAFSFYAILSMAPLLVVAVTLMSLVIRGAENRLISGSMGFIGPDGATFLRSLIDKTRNPNASIVATSISLAVTFFGASNLFLQLQDAMNAIWRIRQEGPLIHSVVKTRLLAFAGVLFLTTTLSAWMVLDTWLNRLSREAGVHRIWPYLNFLFTLVVLAAGFAFSFKALPKNRLKWKDVWPAAILTAVGVGISKFLLGQYFTLAGLSSAYGAAGVLVVILLWIYYTAQIYFFGAEFAFVWAHTFGSMPQDHSTEQQQSTLEHTQTKTEA